MRYNVSPPKNKKFYNFPILNRLIVKAWSEPNLHKIL